MQKLQFNINITDEQKKEILDSIQTILDCGLDYYLSIRNEPEVKKMIRKFSIFGPKTDIRSKWRIFISNLSDREEIETKAMNKVKYLENIARKNSDDFYILSYSKVSDSITDREFYRMVLGVYRCEGDREYFPDDLSLILYSETAPQTIEYCRKTYSKIVLKSN